MNLMKWALTACLCSMFFVGGCSDDKKEEVLPVCGDGLLGGSELCDDSNAVDGDGCAGNCLAIEDGYECKTLGEACTKIEEVIVLCGNSLIDAGETCDDANANAGDGCSQTCQIEDGYECKTLGEACTKIEEEIIVCGDGIISTGEVCDDGNDTGGDGCSSACQKEEGYTCPEANKACIKLPDVALCGDSIVSGEEVCDDGNTYFGDGCSDDCLTLESGFSCEDTVEGTVCQPWKCGNDIHEIENDEDCDKGYGSKAYGLEGDGSKACTSDCRFAPYCNDGNVDTAFAEVCDLGVDAEGLSLNTNAYGGCAVDCQAFGPSCGDALIESKLEICDDGNNVNGDGCSANCKTIEIGFTCPATGGACKALKCGNGTVDDGEQCDDRNYASGDGCSELCIVESGYKCIGKVGDTACKECVAKGVQCTKIVHGNGVVDIDGYEQCDDGNLINGDGCTSDGKIEPGYVCPDAGKPCIARACGDGILAYGEQCDDGNTKDADGCSARCRLEDGYHCATPGKPCIKATCGNGKLEGFEKCDDGNKTNGDGCSATCQIEISFECPTPGAPCINTSCGDKKVRGGEECDDGNRTNSDGCSSLCLIETGYACPTPGVACIKSPCGDGFRAKGEECDDGNLLPNDGCSPMCTREAVFECLDNVCKPVCGDGVTLWMLDKSVAEECDDGNLVNGDGCSSTCKIEDGFACTAFSTAKPPIIRLPVTYRDFRGHNTTKAGGGDGYFSKARIDALKAQNAACVSTNSTCYVGFRENYGHADFECAYGAPQMNDLVQKQLSKDGKPVFAKVGEAPASCTASGKRQITCKESFDMWFNDVPMVNRTFEYYLNLWQTGPTSSTYLFDSDNPTRGGTVANTRLDGKPLTVALFTPLTGVVNGYDDEKTLSGVKQNFGFTTEIHTYFQYKGGEALTFSGDDDVWVFINNRLFVDLGGMHGRQEKSNTLAATNFAGKDKDGKPVSIKHDKAFEVYEGGIYDIHLFQAERCPDGSNFSLTLSGFLNTGKAECNSICGDGLVRGAEQCDVGNVTPARAAILGCVNCQNKPLCGNGKIEAGEGCDTGHLCNGVSDPRCLGVVYKADAACDTVKCTYASCNNGLLDTAIGEECDCKDGVCRGLKAGQVCLPTCKISRCGDGTLDITNKVDVNGKLLPEACDDGNTNNEDACTTVCQAPYCGDGILSSFFGEVCDDGINDGRYGGCGMGCSFFPPSCGDAVVQTANGEECDLGVAKNTGLYNGCTNACKRGPRCGDGQLNTDHEACDDGNNKNGDGCSSICQVEIN